MRDRKTDTVACGDGTRPRARRGARRAGRVLRDRGLRGRGADRLAARADRRRALRGRARPVRHPRGPADPARRAVPGAQVPPAPGRRLQGGRQPQGGGRAPAGPGAGHLPRRRRQLAPGRQAGDAGPSRARTAPGPRSAGSATTATTTTAAATTCTCPGCTPPGAPGGRCGRSGPGPSAAEQRALLERQRPSAPDRRGDPGRGRSARPRAPAGSPACWGARAARSAASRRSSRQATKVSSVSIRSEPRFSRVLLQRPERTGAHQRPQPGRARHQQLGHERLGLQPARRAQHPSQVHQQAQLLEGVAQLAARRWARPPPRSRPRRRPAPGCRAAPGRSPGRPRSGPARRGSRSSAASWAWS